MKKEETVFAYGILYLGITAVAFALAYMGYDQQYGAIQKLRVQLQETATNNLAIYKKNSEYGEAIKELHLKVVQLGDRVGQVEMEQGTVHEHFERLQKGQTDLQDKVSKKKPLIKMPRGPIQVEIYTPTKNLGAKAKKSGG